MVLQTENSVDVTICYFPSLRMEYGWKIAYGNINFPSVRTGNSVCMHIVFHLHGRKIAYNYQFRLMTVSAAMKHNSLQLGLQFD